ncbi:cytochrome P450 71D10-like [Vicia villosa]|uniref:cytochrome P450 71D10-like n=1 Tax=Vicia villosa TaxID=3911 RepID=UPI00273BB4D7|nr:cytochrome P450 71D10-like [Vicia villosa]
MELEPKMISSPIFLSFFFLFIIIILIWNSTKPKSSNSKLPPGPPKLPLIGNIHQLGSVPHHSLKKLSQKYGPLMHIKLGQIPIIVVSSPEIAKQIMKTHDTKFSNRPHLVAADIITYGTKGITFSPYGSYWRQMRKICTFELLTPKRVESFRSIREHEVSNIMEKIRLNEGSSINLTKKIGLFSYGLTSRIALGAKSEDQEAFMVAMKDVLKLIGGFSVADLFPSFKVLHGLTGIRTKSEKVHREIDRILEKILGYHKVDTILETKVINEKDGEDLVGVLLRLQKENNLEHPLSDSVIKANMLDIFSAGSGTSSKASEWAMSELIRNPTVMKKAQTEVRSVFDAKGYVDEANIQELKYLKLVIKETLRLHGPVPLLLPKECSERCEINGYEIPAKTKVIVNAYAIGMDPNYWNEPTKFYPERFVDSEVDYKGVDFQFIPFGAGRRMCPGITFGVVNVEILLANLLFHFDWKMVDGKKGEELDMTESYGLTLKKKHDLYLIPIMYHSSLKS